MTSIVDVTNYAHSPIHQAIAARDYFSLCRILQDLPRLCDPSEIRNEADSLREEEKADAIAMVIDRRDVPNRDTPLHLAVKLGNETATEMLMAAGANYSLQNERGWSAVQEAICNKAEGIAMIIVRHMQPLAWAKWCRRSPQLIATMGRMRDFYLEITFHFESSVIPFISKIAPSDTYKIWKRGANLRVDMTLAGFDGFRIQRSDQTILFLGDGSDDWKVPPGSFCVISHKDKDVMKTLGGPGAPANDEEVKQKVLHMSQTNIFRPGIDVTESEISPQLTWRRQERTEMVGSWKTKVYDMHNVVMSIKSRRVPGAMTDEEFFSSSHENEMESKELDDLLTDEEKTQLEVALKLNSSELNNENGDDVIGPHHSRYEQREILVADVKNCKNVEVKSEKKGWFGVWKKRDEKQDASESSAPPRSSCRMDDKVGGLLGDSPTRSRANSVRHSVGIVHGNELQRENDTKASSSTSSESGKWQKDGNHENEYKKGLRPVLWLSMDFPLQTEELLPLLDILASKVKAIRRLRELLTTKLPVGTFPVKVAIPVVPTIRVLITFTKFEELRSVDGFFTPPSSPSVFRQESPVAVQSENTLSWFRWIKAPYNRSSSSASCSKSSTETINDPFFIPTDYTWITPEERKKKMEEKKKLKKGKS